MHFATITAEFVDSAATARARIVQTDRRLAEQHPWPELLHREGYPPLVSSLVNARDWRCDDQELLKGRLGSRALIPAGKRPASLIERVVRQRDWRAALRRFVSHFEVEGS